MSRKKQVAVFLHLPNRSPVPLNRKARRQVEAMKRKRLSLARDDRESRQDREIRQRERRAWRSMRASRQKNMLRVRG